VSGLSPNSFSYPSLIADLFTLYRIESLDFTFYPSTVAYGIAVIPGITTAPATALTINNVLQNRFNLYVPTTITVPQRLRIPRSMLMDTAQKFYKTLAGTGDSPDNLYQATILVVSSGAAVSISYEVKARIRLVGPVATAYTPSPDSNYTAHIKSSNKADVKLPTNPPCEVSSENWKKLLTVEEVRTILDARESATAWFPK